MILKKVATQVNIDAEGIAEDALHERLRHEAQEAAKKAYAPYSKFRVGAAALLSNGEIISGSNQENAAYPSGLCAERVTLFYANAKYPDEKVTHLMIVAETDEGTLKTPITPCGACRQVIIEKETVQGSPIEISLAGAETTYVLKSAQELMPLSFIPSSLDNK